MGVSGVRLSLESNEVLPRSLPGLYSALCRRKATQTASRTDRNFLRGSAVTPADCFHGLTRDFSRMRGPAVLLAATGRHWLPISHQKDEPPWYAAVNLHCGIYAKLREAGHMHVLYLMVSCNNTALVVIWAAGDH
jgi:hypothetical protein